MTKIPQFAICETKDNSLSLSMKSHNGMRPHDIAVLLKILSMEEGWLSKDLSASLFISGSEISESLNRSMIAKLLSPNKRTVYQNSLFDFIVNGLKYVFPVEPGGMTRGVATAHSAPVLKDFFVFDDNYVWPCPQGNTKGFAIQPLYPNQPLAALADATLYDKLALLDAIRFGRTRERNKAVELLHNTLKSENAREYYQDQSR